MNKIQMAAWTTALSLLVAFCTFAGGEERKRIRIAVLPCSDEVQTITKFSLLMKYLQAETGFELELSVSSSTAHFDNSVKNGDFDFVLQDPNTYVAYARFLQPASLLSALNGDGEAVQQGAIIVRKDRGIRNIENLRGKDVMFGNELSATKWTAARELLEKHGLDVEKDLRNRTVGGCCEDIAFNVYLGAVDAGMVCAHFISENSGKQKELGIDMDALMVVGLTRLVPERVFAAHRRTEQAVVEKIVGALLGLEKNDPEMGKILSRAELGGFQESDRPGV